MCLFIIISISVMRHELWCTVRDMRLSKCSIIIICEKALRIYADLIKGTSSTSAEGESGFIFYACGDWVEKI